MRAWNRRAWLAWLPALALAEGCGATQAAADHSWVPAVLGPAVFIVITLLMGLIPANRTNRSLLLETVSPEAVRAIRHGLAAAGLPIPDQILLGGRGITTSRFSAFPRRSAQLYVALPQLLAAPSSYLPVLAASAMAVGQVTAYPASTQRLWDKRVALEARHAALVTRGKSLSRQARRINDLLAVTESFADAVRERSDQAAALAAGSTDAAARALYSELTINLDFFRYISRFRRLIVRKKRIPGSLHAGWLAQWSADPEWVQYRTRYPIGSFREEHRGLGAFDADALSSHISRLRKGEEGTAAAAIVSPDLAKRLAKQVGKQISPSSNAIRAVEGSAIDVTYVYEHDDEDEAAIIHAATTILGRPADRVDVVNLFQAHRGPELAAVLLDPTDIDDDDPDGGLSRGTIYAVLLFAAVHARGMYRLDPYREWIVTGRDGESLDVSEIVAQAVSPHGDTDRLRSLL